MKYLILLILLSSCASEYKRIDNRVNNLITYKFDEVEYWQTPKETIALGTGDCEDYAILKWSMLIDAGANPNDVYFNLVQIKTSDVHHLIIEHDGKYYDNYMKNRGVYSRDFELKERFKITDAISYDTALNEKFQDMKTRHFDNNHRVIV